jgi:predicted DNA-binding transcriptional regulator YafY
MMSKPDRLLILLHLLSHRRSVTLETIASVCGIPERTAYRYLNTLSEANIPVHFDRQLGGYCLTFSTEIQFDELDLQEISLLVSCLLLLVRHVNRKYQIEIGRLVEKIISRQSFALETAHGIPRILNEVSTAKPLRPDYSGALSMQLVQSAIHARRAVQLTLEDAKDPTGDDEQLEFGAPRLLFDRKWIVSDDHASSPAMADLSRITHVGIKKGPASLAASGSDKKSN